MTGRIMKMQEQSGSIADGVRERIISAARDVFSESGFEGASLRQIAGRADVQHQLVVYHYKTKDLLWRATLASLLTGGDRLAGEWLRTLEKEGPLPALRQMIREFIQFVARHPEYHRIVTFEGRTDNERLRWLIKNYNQPFYDISTHLIREAQARGAIRAGHPGQLHYAMIGLVSTSFVFAPEYSLMTGLAPFEAAQVESVINLACDLFAIPKA